MKRIRKKVQKENVQEFKSHFFNTREKIIGLCVAAAIIFCLVVALLLVESKYGKFIVKNNTDINLENLTYTFVDAEDVLTEISETGAIKAGTKYTTDMTKANLRYKQANLEVRFTFEGHEELLTDVGYFIDNFDGNIKVTFNKTDDPNLIKFSVKASNGIFNTKTVDCDESFTINLSEGRLYE